MPSSGTTGQRGYGADHKTIRKKLEPLVRSGNAICWRCGLPIKADANWDLGHDDYDRKQYRGPEHANTADCPAGGNRATKGRQRPATDTSRQW